MISQKYQTQLFAIGLLILVCLACKSLGAPHTLKSRDGKFELTVPADMAESTTLSKDADLQATNNSKEIFMFAISKPKSDYADDMTLDRLTEMVRKALMDQLSVTNSPEPESITVNGNSAIRYRLDGTKDGVKIAYLITNIETKDRFYRIYSWTSPSKYGENEKTLKEISESFRASE